jgi:hypothetical protein
MSKEPIVANLERARRDLLELTTRTRLLDAPRHKDRSRTVEIDDELSDEIFRLLVHERRAMVFDPRVEEDDDDLRLFDGSTVDDDTRTFAVDDSCDDDTHAARHTDNRLQTPYSKIKLQKRLLSMYFDACTYEEEQGVSILYLAFGFLRWYDTETSDRARHAPLILLPVQLERQSARHSFKLSCPNDEISTNLVLLPFSWWHTTCSVA